MNTPTSFRALERIVRGFSCHRRIQIVTLLDETPEAISLTEISSACRAGFRPIGEHVRRLHVAGLVVKQSKGRKTLHELTPLGRKVVKFLRTIP